MCTRVRLYARGTGNGNNPEITMPVSLITWFDMDLVCIIMYCQYTKLAILKEVKGLTNKLYAYALVRKKTGLHAKFQVHRLVSCASSK